MNARVDSLRIINTVEKTINTTFRFHCRYPFQSRVSEKSKPGGGSGGSWGEAICSSPLRYETEDGLGG